MKSTTPVVINQSDHATIGVRSAPAIVAVVISRPGRGDWRPLGDQAYRDRRCDANEKVALS